LICVIAAVRDRAKSWTGKGATGSWGEDKALLRTDKVESAVRINRAELFRLGTALFFIVAVMLITVPLAGALAAMFFFMIRGMMIS
jgi:hypothetical protein